jgi:hypothetical protein
MSSLIAILAEEAAVAGAPHTGPEGEPAAGAIAAVEVAQTATSPVSRAGTTMPVAESKKFGATNPQARTTTSPPSLHGFAIYFSRRNSNHWGSPKYDAKQDPVQWLRCYALYFPFCLDQAPLTWLESLEKYSIDKWDQLKDQFTSNFAGAMGRSGTCMDLAMVKQEQGETLRKYMRRFFGKRATVVDVTDKEVIDLFQDGLYHRRAFEDFGCRHSSSITHLKDMITSWADEEDKANAKYDAICGKSKQNTGGNKNNNNKNNNNNNNNNNRDQGGRSSNYSGPNCKSKPDNTVATIQRPAKDN